MPVGHHLFGGYFLHTFTCLVFVCPRCRSLLCGVGGFFEYDCLTGLFVGLVLSVHAFYCFSMESLILAQDERWRRA